MALPHLIPRSLTFPFLPILVLSCDWWVICYIYFTFFYFTLSLKFELDGIELDIIFICPGIQLMLIIL